MSQLNVEIIYNWTDATPYDFMSTIFGGFVDAFQYFVNLLDILFDCKQLITRINNRTACRRLHARSYNYIQAHSSVINNATYTYINPKLN